MLHYAVVYEGQEQLPCKVCDTQTEGRLYFDEDEEDDPHNHASWCVACSDTCAKRIIEIAERHYASANMWQQIDEELWNSTS